MKKRTIVGIQITERTKGAVKLQETLTKFGCTIKTRLGLHEATTQMCSTSGLIILELLDESPDRDILIDELKGLPGIQVQTMEFESK